MSDDEGLRRARVELERVELELERAHHLLDQAGVPRETDGPGGRPLDLALAERIRLLFEEE